VSTLQDQLLKSGLVNSKKAKQVSKEKRKKAKVQHKSKQVEVDETKENVKQAMQEKVERDRQLNADRDAIAAKKALIAQIKQLISLNKESRGRGDVAYKFTDGSKIKSMHVSDEIQNQLIRGNLAIASLDGKYELVPAGIAEKIALRDDSFIVCKNEKSEEVDEDDPYAEFEIPDDLMW